MNIRKLFAAVTMTAAASAAAVAATEQLRIMTYNIPMGNILVTDGNGRNTWENRCNEIHKYLLHVAPDVLGMQEPVKQELCDILRGTPGYAMVGTGRDDGKDKGEYTCIIYRIDKYRVLESGNYWLTNTPDVHSRVEGSGHYRIATWALIESLESGAQFLYTNTHLSYDSEPVRKQQIQVVKQHMLDLNQRFGPDLPHFLTGDFNMRDSEENYTYVLNWKLLMKDLWTSTRTRHHYSTGSTAPTGRIDYIYATQRNVTSVRAQWDNRKTPDGFWMSDHDPLWADATWRTSVADDARAAIRRARAQVDSTMSHTQLRQRLVTAMSQIATDGLDGSSSLRYAIDLSSGTAIQTASCTPTSQPHYIQAEIRQQGVDNIRFTYYRRTDNGTDGMLDRWQDVMVMASDDGQKWNYICHIYNFGDVAARSQTSPNISLGRPYKYVRFDVLRTPGMRLSNGHARYGLAEFQLYANQLSPVCPYALYPELKEQTDQLKALILQVEAELEAGTIARTHTAQLDEATQALTEALATATSIQTPAQDMATHPQGIYDLQGRRLSSPGRGIRIVGGRKVAY